MAAVVDYDDVVVVVAVAGHDAVAGSPVRAYLHFVAAVAVGLSDQLVEVVLQRNPYRQCSTVLEYLT